MHEYDVINNQFFYELVIKRMNITDSGIRFFEAIPNEDEFRLNFTTKYV